MSDTHTARAKSHRWLLPMAALFSVCIACDGSLSMGGDDHDAGGNGINVGDGTVVGDGSSSGVLDATVDPDDPWWKCLESETTVTLKPLDMLVGLDVSQSMIFPPDGVEFPSKWVSVREALKSYVTSPTVSGAMGLEYFPEYPQCKADMYEVLDVDIKELPKDAADIVRSLDAKSLDPAGATPLVQVLQGLLTSARARAAAEPEHKVIIVLATDGAPQGCPVDLEGVLANTIDNAQAVAEDALTGTPSVPVFVIGVGDLDVLDAIAEAGGTEEALIVGVGKDGAQLQSTFAQALEDIRRRAVFCDYEIPQPDVVDLERINVRYTVGNTVEHFVFVGDAKGCTESGQSDVGWYFDNVENPRHIKLCGGSCSKVQDNASGKVDIIFGCKTSIF